VDAVNNWRSFEVNDLEVAKDLRGAADYLRTHGWIQGALGEPGGSRCAMGAIYSATSEYAYIEEDLWPDTPAFPGNALHRLAKFNDQPGRTAAQVIDLLESTALGLEVRHLAATRTAESVPEPA
jgi:hypothetical protein